MSAQYSEIVVGASSYVASAPGVTAPFQPQYQTFTPMGASGCDVFLSWDGSHDHARIKGPGATGAQAPGFPVRFDVDYQRVWMRMANGVTATVGVGFYSK